MITCVLSWTVADQFNSYILNLLAYFFGVSIPDNIVIFTARSAIYQDFVLSQRTDECVEKWLELVDFKETPLSTHIRYFSFKFRAYSQLLNGVQKIKSSTNACDHIHFGADAAAAVLAAFLLQVRQLSVVPFVAEGIECEALLLKSTLYASTC